ncbi:MAG: FMN-binding glutamate synthase family protein [Rhodanobacteraceae bacterium]
MIRIFFYILSVLALIGVAVAAPFWPHALYYLILIVPLIGLGFYDIASRHNVLTNYPIIGHLRYMLEFISPEIRQYFLESDKSGRPYNRQQRNLVYERGRGEEGVHPFGTEFDPEQAGYNFALHGIDVKKVPKEAARVTIGGPQCRQPYSSSRLNISAMSFGALSSRAVLAMNRGAKLGGFAQDTGEGGLAPYHLEYGADVIWEIASAYFGCRTHEGRFNDEVFREKANRDEIKMIEIKLSQGAKPGHGGLLPAAKVTKEIAEVRGIPEGKDCLSPPTHPEFSTPRELMEFIVRVRELCNGKPVGFKLCVGHRSDFMGICKAMLETGVRPDFITVDGSEGGTGAAPIELTDRIGMMINEALPFVHSVLVGAGLRDDIKLIASGRIVSGFDMAHKVALGADVCNMARPMMFAVGCIQALRCHTNTCPTGVATQDPRRARAIHVENRGERVYHFHKETMNSFLDMVGIMGVDHPDKLTPGHILHRLPDQRAASYEELYQYLVPGELLGDNIPERFAAAWNRASADAF